MEKSSSLNTSTVEDVINQAVDYLQTWTKKELATIMDQHATNGRIPLVAKIGSKGYLIGSYAVQPTKTGWWKVTYRYNEEEDLLFSSKSSAFIYILFRHNNYHNRADQILLEDSEVRRWTVKAEQYQYRYRQAAKKKNTLKTDLFYIRYQETLSRLKQSKFLLEKSLRSAKYFKL